MCNIFIVDVIIIIIIVIVCVIVIIIIIIVIIVMIYEGFIGICNRKISWKEYNNT